MRAHIFLCMLACYADWHMREAWRELVFADTEQSAKANRDPVTPTQRSKQALAKLTSHAHDDGTPAPRFSTLMAETAAVVRSTCRTPSAVAEARTFDVATIANDKQRRALELIQNSKP